MAHKFEGDWRYFEVDHAHFPPNPPNPFKGPEPLKLVIPNVDLAPGSVHNGVALTGRVTDTTITMAEDQFEDHHTDYEGLLVSEGPVTVIVGGFRRQNLPGPLPEADKDSLAPAPADQEEGIWIIIK